MRRGPASVSVGQGSTIAAKGVQAAGGLAVVPRVLRLPGGRPRRSLWSGRNSNDFPSKMRDRTAMRPALRVDSRGCTDGAGGAAVFVCMK